MKKFFVIIGLLAIAMPTSADIVNPNLTPEQLKEIQKRKYEMFVERQRNTTINRVCGIVKSTSEMEKCKKKLYKDYLETINFLESKYENEYKNVKNTVDK